MQVAYVYFLFDAHEATFKIGKAVDIWSRIKQLPDAIDTDRSRCIVFRSHELSSASVLALKLESLLKTVCKNENRPKLHGKDGYTEWFNLDAFHRIEKFIQSDASEFFGCGPLRQLPEQKLITKAKIYEDAEQKEIRQQQLNDEIKASNSRNNVLIIDKFYTWLVQLKTEGSVVGLFDTSLITWGSDLEHPTQDEIKVGYEKYGERLFVFRMNSGPFRRYDIGGNQRLEKILGCCEWSEKIQFIIDFIRRTPKVPSVCVNEIDILTRTLPISITESINLENQTLHLKALESMNFKMQKLRN